MLPVFKFHLPFFEGEPAAGGAAPAAPPAPPAAPPAPSGPPATPQASQPSGSPSQPAPDRVAQLEKDLKSAREEAAGYRTQNKGQLAELRKALAPLLGLEPGTEAPTDAAAVLAQLQERDRKRESQLRELQLSNALQDAARKHGADTDLLVPFLKGSAALDKVDLAAENFTKEIGELVKGLLEKNPKLRANIVPARSSVDPNNAPPTVPQLTKQQVQEMAKAGQHEQIEEARKKGQLDQLMRGGI